MCSLYTSALLKCKVYITYWYYTYGSLSSEALYCAIMLMLKGNEQFAMEGNSVSVLIKVIDCIFQ